MTIPIGSAPKRTVTNLQKTRNKLLSLRRQRLDEVKVAELDAQEIDRQIDRVEQEITELLSKGPYPIVTEHAIFRYLQRVKGWDFTKYEAEILELPEHRLVRNGRVVVTVLPEPTLLTNGGHAHGPAR